MRVATDAFGNALGESLGAALKPTDARTERYAAQSSKYMADLDADVQGILNRPSPVDVKGLIDAVAIPDFARDVVGEAWAADVAERKLALDPWGLRAASDDMAGVMRRAGSLFTPTFARGISDTASDAEITAHMLGEAGYDGELLPVGGVRVTPSIGIRPATVNGISVNNRAATLFEAGNDLLGMAEMYRDYRLLGGLLQKANQEELLKGLKNSLLEKLGTRLLPTPEDMGAVRSQFGDGTAGYLNTDLIERYSDALRKMEMAKQGII